jgi:hypothetical protein
MNKVTPALAQVYEITDLHVGVLESFPPQLDITVRGMVLSSGWTNPQLRPYTYVQAPPDGVYDFDFVATPPMQPSHKDKTRIRLHLILPGGGMNGIRIHAMQNSKEVIFAHAGDPTA